MSQETITRQEALEALYRAASQEYRRTPIGSREESVAFRAMSLAYDFLHQETQGRVTLEVRNR